MKHLSPIQKDILHFSQEKAKPVTLYDYLDERACNILPEYREKWSKQARKEFSLMHWYRFVKVGPPIYYRPMTVTNKGRRAMFWP